MCSSWKANVIWHANHSIKLNWSRVIEFLVSAELCTIVTSSARQSRWCCDEVASYIGLFVPAFYLRTAYIRRTKFRVYGVFVPAWSPIEDDPGGLTLETKKAEYDQRKILRLVVGCDFSWVVWGKNQKLRQFFVVFFTPIYLKCLIFAATLLGK